MLEVMSILLDPGGDFRPKMSFDVFFGNSENILIFSEP